MDPEINETRFDLYENIAMQDKAQYSECERLLLEGRYKETFLLTSDIDDPATMRRYEIKGNLFIHRSQPVSLLGNFLLFYCRSELTQDRQHFEKAYRWYLPRTFALPV